MAKKKRSVKIYQETQQIIDLRKRGMTLYDLCKAWTFSPSLPSGVSSGDVVIATQPALGNEVAQSIASKATRLQEELAEFRRWKENQKKQGEQTPPQKFERAIDLEE